MKRLHFECVSYITPLGSTFNPLETGNTLVCGLRFETAINTEELFIQYFLEILKRMVEVIEWEQMTTWTVTTITRLQGVNSNLLHGLYN